MPPSRDALDLAAALGALHRQVNILYGVIARRFGFTTQQIELLCHLVDRAPSLGELAATLGCDKTNVTGMVDRLERRGLVRRTTDPADRRVSRVTLSEQGAALAPRIRSAVAEAIADTLGSLDTADRGRLTDLALAAVHALRAGPSGLATSPPLP
ncbi:MarR family transcriptional regulator [Pseudofrankia sp. DC12]|uniref:MarR family winged helix-turn-helix transcriptional regulator n=1 Tax=Pseudofrankia sp. DC12 TaxID=683315 RepID=UPI0005F88580|nr:MarR family transcriptional regulator [Pseudofrankia sp. DC12]